MAKDYRDGGWSDEELDLVPPPRKPPNRLHRFLGPGNIPYSESRPSANHETPKWDPPLEVAIEKMDPMPSESWKERIKNAINKYISKRRK